MWGLVTRQGGGGTNGIAAAEPTTDHIHENAQQPSHPSQLVKVVGGGRQGGCSRVGRWVGSGTKRVARTTPHPWGTRGMRSTVHNHGVCAQPTGPVVHGWSRTGTSNHGETMNGRQQ